MCQFILFRYKSQSFEPFSDSSTLAIYLIATGMEAATVDDGVWLLLADDADSVSQSAALMGGEHHDILAAQVISIEETIDRHRHCHFRSPPL